MTARALVLLPVLLLVAAAPQDAAQDIQAFLAKPKDGDLAAAARGTARRALDRLAEDKKSDAIWIAVLRIVTQGAADPAWISRDSKRVSSHLESIKLGDHLRLSPAEHLEHAKSLSAAKGGPLYILAMAHLEAANVPERSEAIKALKLVEFDGRFGDADSILLARILSDRTKRSETLVAVDETYAKSRCVEVQYVRTACLLKTVSKEIKLAADLFKALDELKKDATAKAHAEALISGLNVYFRCDACKGKRQVRCDGCAGKGSREIVCTYCNGEGKFVESQSPTSTSYKGCPACLNKNPKRTDKCNFCAGMGTVACERCKYLIPKYEDLVSEKACARCEGQGLLFKSAAVACFECRGLGRILQPSADPQAFVSPRE
jgi:hypothetical protein